MPKIDEFWTDDPPEVGKRYWFASNPHGEGYDSDNVFDAVFGKNLFIDAWSKIVRESGYIRSILPIPDPIPPPLPGAKEKA